MATALRDPAFRAYAPQFEEVVGEEPRLAPVVETDAHEGPVYFADENALYFTTPPKPGVDGAPSVQIKRLDLDQPEQVSVLVEEANAANGMAPDREGGLLVCEQGSRSEHARISRLDRLTGERETVIDHWRADIAKAVATADVKERLETLGFAPVANTPDEFGARIKLEIAKWSKVVHAANIKAD